MNAPNEKKKSKTSRKKELLVADENASKPTTKRERLTNNTEGPKTLRNKKERNRLNNDAEQSNMATKREGRAVNRTAEVSKEKPKSRSRSVRSDKTDRTEKDVVPANTKTEAELLEELRQDDDKPMRPQDIRRGELVSQHVPHYALPTKKLELRTDGRLSKLYVPKKPQFSASEWPDDLDKSYCKMVVDTIKDMYQEQISDPNWVYNQRKSYLNFLNTAEWQEMDLKLAKMSFQQLLQEEPLQKIPTF